MIGDVAPLRDFAEGGVGVGIRDGSVALVEFHHVFGQVPAVGKPAARRLDSQRGGASNLVRCTYIHHYNNERSYQDIGIWRATYRNVIESFRSILRKED